MTLAPATASEASAHVTGPFLKWVGGKQRLVRTLEQLYPPGIELMRHVEPFLGGGALFFARRPSRALLSDINADLVQTYRCVRDELNELLRHLGALAQQAHSEVEYLRARTRFNQRDHHSLAERSALFIYLNKTCFNGLFRVNRRGEFNVPCGRYHAPRIVDISRLKAARRALARAADIRCSPFEALLESVRPGDFVYLDPPYVPQSRSSNFTAYAPCGFAHADQVRLRDVFRELDRRGASLMLSNSDTPLVRELFAAFHLTTVRALRSVNSDISRRGPVQELVVTNYDPARVRRADIDPAT